MRCAIAFIVLAATSATVFNAGDAATCFVDAEGSTIVHYTVSLHPHFKCTHSGTTCTCSSTHPTHAMGECKEFDHTDGSTHSVGGDCSDAGRPTPAPTLRTPHLAASRSWSTTAWPGTSTKL